MALFELKQDMEHTGGEAFSPPTFKDCAAVDIDAVFFNGSEHADRHTVDGRSVLVILVESDHREYSAHWEAGAKQNFDTGLYVSHDILYIRVKDYGPKPKQGKVLVLDGKRTYAIRKCEDQGGVYRMTLERTRQA